MPDGKKGRPKGTGLPEDDAVVSRVALAEIAAFERQAAGGAPRFNRAAELRRALGRHPGLHELSRLNQKIRKRVAEGNPGASWLELSVAGTVSDPASARTLLEAIHRDLSGLGFGADEARGILSEALGDALVFACPLTVEVGDTRLRGHEFGDAYALASSLRLDAMTVFKEPRLWTAHVDSGRLGAVFHAFGDQGWCLELQSLRHLVGDGKADGLERILATFDKLLFGTDIAFSPDGEARAPCAELFPELAEALAAGARRPMIGEEERAEIAECLRRVTDERSPEERLLRAVRGVG